MQYFTWTQGCLIFFLRSHGYRFYRNSFCHWNFKKSCFAEFIFANHSWSIKIPELIQGRIQRFRKEGALYVGHHDWPAKKILSFRWSKKAKIMLEAIISRWNISISIFSNEKGKSEKCWTLFYNRLFYKSLLIIDYFFYFTSSFAVQVLLSYIRMTQKMSNGEIGYDK